MVKKIFIVTIVFIGLLYIGCKKEKAAEIKVETPICVVDTSIKISFCRDILPIFNNNCNLSGCHNSASALRGVVLSNHSQIKEQVVNGIVICAIEHGDDCNVKMPYQKPKLLDEQIQLIKDWQDKGAPNN